MSTCNAVETGRNLAKTALLPTFVHDGRPLYCLTLADLLYCLPQARDLDLDNKTRNDGPSRFALQKLSTEQTAARASESVVRENIREL